MMVCGSRTQPSLMMAIQVIHKQECDPRVMGDKCDPRIIDIVASLYTGDEMEINVNDVMGNMQVRNATRQGCTGSPQLFLMVVNVIIIKLMKNCWDFKMETCMCLHCFMRMTEC